MPADLSQFVNDAFIALHRGLLSYAAESWPWTAGSKGRAEEEALREMTAVRKQDLTDLANWLLDHHAIIDLGVYPLDYGNLHYVALDFLVQEIAADEGRVADRVAELAKAVAGDSSAAHLLAEAAASARANQERLRAFAKQPQPA